MCTPSTSVSVWAYPAYHCPRLQSILCPRPRTVTNPLPQSFSLRTWCNRKAWWQAVWDMGRPPQSSKPPCHSARGHPCHLSQGQLPPLPSPSQMVPLGGFVCPPLGFLGRVGRRAGGSKGKHNYPQGRDKASSSVSCWDHVAPWGWGHCEQVSRRLVSGVCF